MLSFDTCRSRAAGIAFLILATPAAAAEGTIADWTIAERGATAVVAPAEPAAAAAARRLAEGVEARRLLLASLLEAPLPAATPAVFYLLPAGEDGRPFGLPAGGARLAASERGVLGVAALPLEPQAERQLLAAAVEALLADHLGPLPAFWRDGFAELLVDLELGPQGARPIASEDRLALLAGNEWLSLSQFSEVDLDQKRPETRRRLASQVWAILFYDLVVAPQQRAKLTKFLHLALAGESASTAFAAAYGTYYDEVQIKVRDASRRSNGKAFAKFTTTFFPVALPAFQEKKLAAPAADAELGLLLVELKAPAAAAARCAAAREAAPELPRALLCEARLLEQSGELVAARAGYEKAAAAAPDDGLVAYVAGAAWLRPAPDDPAADPAEALVHLRRARELQPALGDAWAGAALAAYHSQPRPADAIALTEEAHQRVPRRTDVGLALYRLYQEAGRQAEAEALARQDVILRRKVIRAPGGPAMPLAPGHDGAVATDRMLAATTLIQEGKYEEALAIYLELRQGADNPAIANPLDAKIAELRQTIAHNQFVGKYNAAAEHFNHQRWDETIATLEELLPTLGDELQKKKADDLLGQARRMKAEYARIADHNDFIAVVNKATALYNQRRFQEAADMVARRLEAGLADPEDLKLAKAFLDQCHQAAAQRRGG